MARVQIVIFSAAAVFILGQQTEAASVLNTVIGSVFSSVSACNNELHENISPEFCLLGFDGEHNPNDAQFGSCRRTLTCAFKKMNLMTPDGNWNDGMLTSLRDRIKTEEVRNDFDAVYKTCRTVGGTNEEGVTNMISCILKNSDQAIQTYTDFKDLFKSGYEDGK